MTAEIRGRQRERGKSPGNHWKSRKGRSKSRARVECWNYGKKGHFKKDCLSQNVKKRDGQQENKQEVNITGDVLQHALHLLAPLISIL